MHLEHAYLKKNLIEKRYYQESIINSCKNKNSLIVLPTGIGKTIIAIGIIANRLEKHPLKKILFLAPTKPLAKQHQDSLFKFLDFEKEKITLLTGQITPEKRKAIYKDAQIIIATPQVIENDILNSVINLDDFSLIVFDEAHRTIGDYAYNFIAKKYFEKNTEQKIIIALTASPGSEGDKISEICNNLFVEHIEIRKEDDEDIKPYVHQIKKKWIMLELNYQYKTAINLLDKTAEKSIKKLQDAKVIFSSRPSKKQLLLLQREMMEKIRSDKNPSYFNCISLISRLIKLNYLTEVLSTQGAPQANQYVNKLKLEQTKAAKSLFANNDFRTALIHIDKLSEHNELHPKIQKLNEILVNEIRDGKKAIVFTQYVNTVEQICNSLEAANNSKIKPVKFIGQRISNTQKQQIETLNKFRADEFNVLVSTSVGEEGLDIPKVDVVVFYEPIPSEIRTIQRRGRTGRQKTGCVYILMTKNTIDEGYFWSSKAKEKKMHRTLKELKNAFEKPGVVLGQKKPTLVDFAPNNEKITIIADSRESKINKKLFCLADKNNIELKISQLKVGDFVLSDRVGVERKQIDDFIDSIIDRRLFEQMTSLSSSFLRPIVIMEGTDGNIFNLKFSRNININAVIGAINSIVIDFRIPIYFTKNMDETCNILICLAKREQIEKSRSVQIGTGRKAQNDEDVQEQIIGAFPRINRNLAIKLLDKFKTIKNIANASLDKLVETEGIGTLRAKKIKDVCEWRRK